MVATEGGFYQILADIPKKAQRDHPNRPQPRYIFGTFMDSVARAISYIGAYLWRLFWNTCDTYFQSWSFPHMYKLVPTKIMTRYYHVLQLQNQMDLE